MNRRKIGESYEEAAGVYLQKRDTAGGKNPDAVRRSGSDRIGTGNILYFRSEIQKDLRRRLSGGGSGIGKKENMPCMDYYLYYKRLGESIPVRFDVVAICGESVNWYQNAFDYIRPY